MWSNYAIEYSKFKFAKMQTLNNLQMTHDINVIASGHVKTVALMSHINVRKQRKKERRVCMITERLKIRKFTNNDLTDLYNLLSDEDVMEFIEPPFSWEKTANFLNSVALIDPPLIYAVEDFSQKFIGYVIFHEYDKDSFELGWILNKRYWGKGYANELTKAFIKRSSNIGKNLIIECAPNQENTKRIAMKNDFEFIGESDGCSIFKRKLLK